MIKKSFCIFIITAGLVQAKMPENYNVLLQKIFAYNGERTFLLSYPRSANTWLRYCIEYITQRPSFNRFNLRHNVNYPLGWVADFPIDITKPPIEKVHFNDELNQAGANRNKHALIFILRNPKEVLVRQVGKEKIMMAVKQNKMPVDFAIYFKAIEIFDTWVCPQKIMIHYEDLLQYPKATILEVIQFLNESTERLPEFLDDYSSHRQKCLSIYKESVSGGNDPLFHSKSLTPQERLEIDAWIQRHYPIFWEKYLNIYSESVLKY